MGHWGFIFNLQGFGSFVELGKVGSELMFLFVEKLLSLKKVCGRGPKGPQKNRPVMPQGIFYSLQEAIH